MQLPPQGGPDISKLLQAGPQNTGAATAPQPNLGNMAAAHQKLALALKALEESLPLIPMGSPLHSDILKVTNDLSKKISSAGQPDAQGQIQQLMQMIKSSVQGAPMAALARLMPPGGGPAMGAAGGGAGGGAPGGAPGGMPAAAA